MKLRPITENGRRKWEVLESFLLEGVVIPEGFTTDGASVPRFLWWYISPIDPGIFRAAVLHDYLYCLGENRESADFYFYRCMIKSGVSESKATNAYNAVTLFGWWAYPYNENGAEIPFQRKIKDYIINKIKND